LKREFAFLKNVSKKSSNYILLLLADNHSSSVILVAATRRQRSFAREFRLGTSRGFCEQVSEEDRKRFVDAEGLCQVFVCAKLHPRKEARVFGEKAPKRAPLSLVYETRWLESAFFFFFFFLVTILFISLDEHLKI
jgi:hypothetical protein